MIETLVTITVILAPTAALGCWLLFRSLKRKRLARGATRDDVRYTPHIPGSHPMIFGEPLEDKGYASTDGWESSSQSGHSDFSGGFSGGDAGYSGGGGE